MFNPKENLLDQQLAVSGLEMQWIGAALAGVSAVTSIVGGIKGSQDAKKANDQREANAEDAAKSSIKNRLKKLTNIIKKYLRLKGRITLITDSSNMKLPLKTGDTTSRLKITNIMQLYNGMLNQLKTQTIS